MSFDVPRGTSLMVNVKSNAESNRTEICFERKTFEEIVMLNFIGFFDEKTAEVIILRLKIIGNDCQ